MLSIELIPNGIALNLSKKELLQSILSPVTSASYKTTSSLEQEVIIIKQIKILNIDFTFLVFT
ncbi:hypothetical protein JCM19301_459 [Jejuia pallidilutea]|uniref:Uncharacterized protein n=1 Tax=Jejuia pallidilutea TaxID=504487 RepID=A0A090VS22_9FLAO|nr:hypothetical protein JCM19301_459 [Jejuia pallidilutea]GAL71286.1 hypothetical protein JCM19302_963 [Jejuia pallidilutea]GAL88737.1 hypothetical protein JCM19538_1172 [Jejuia pallidilutea]